MPTLYERIQSALSSPNGRVMATSGHVEFVANDGTLRRLKINGRIKTWKRDPSRIEVSVKYGLYEYGRMDTEEALRRLVVRVPDGSDDND